MLTLAWELFTCGETMRDIDKELGVGAGFRRGADANDEAAVERNRRIGEMLLLADEMEETVNLIRAEGRQDPLQPGKNREEILRALELRTQAERRRLEALEHQGVIDFAAVARAMPLSGSMAALPVASESPRLRRLTRTASNKSVPLEKDRAARPSLRTFFRIAEAWKLGVEEQMKLLGLTSRATYFKWRRDGTDRLSRDTVERLSYIFGIYKGLQILLPAPEAADGWVRRPNDAPLFNGRSALDRMLSGNVADLYVVRQYVDSEVNGWV